MSITSSAARMISSSCSTTTTVLPISLSFLSTEISLSVSLGCNPMLGSSRIYMEPTRELPRAVTRFTLWLSPPESVFMVLFRLRYESPTSFMQRSLETISSIALRTMPYSYPVNSKPAKYSSSSSTFISSSSAMFLPPTLT